MDPRPRVKKPEPERAQPVRNWGVLFGPPGMSPPRAPPNEASPEGAAPPGASVSQGVEMGYRVIEEYLRQGRNVARAVGMPYLGEAPADDGLQHRMGAMLRSFTDFASLWMDLLGRMGPGGAANAPGAPRAMGTAGPFAAGGGAPGPAEAPRDVASSPSVAVEPPVAAPLGLSIELDSTRRVEVSVELRPRSAGLPLVVHDLRAPEPDKPRLTGVEIQGLPDEDRVRLRIRVPEGHPPGVYSGLILDERTSLPRGTLCLRIPPP